MIREKLQTALTLFDRADAVFETEKELSMTSEQVLEDATNARQVLQTVSQTIQERAHSRIASLVSRCLEAVFDEPYEFQIEFESKRGRTEARLVFLRDELSVDPLSASGGGVVDVAAFALRLACLSLSRPPLRRLLILDEPFKFVSKEHRNRIRELIEKLAEEMSIQFIIVTHIAELRCGKIVEL